MPATPRFKPRFCNAASPCGHNAVRRCADGWPKCASAAIYVNCVVRNIKIFHSNHRDNANGSFTSNKSTSSIDQPDCSITRSLQARAPVGKGWESGRMRAARVNARGRLYTEFFRQRFAVITIRSADIGKSTRRSLTVTVPSLRNTGFHVRKIFG